MKTGQLFEKGFESFLENDQLNKESIFSDLTIITDSKKYRVHKLILAYSSEYFKSLLCNDKWKESLNAEIELKFPDPELVFPLALKFIYTGKLTITNDNAIALLACADHYLINRLKTIISEWISAIITKENAVEFIKQAVRYNSNEIKQTCCKVICKNFWSLDQGSLDKLVDLPFDIFYEIISNPSLAVKNESILYQVVAKYVDKYSNVLSKTEIHDLFSHVRFVSLEEIETLDSNDFIPKKFLIEGLVAQLQKQKGVFVSDPNNPRTQPRKFFGLTFQYPTEEEADDLMWQGIIAYLSIDKNESEWKNCHDAKIISCSSSSNSKGDISQLVAFDHSELWTNDIPASWMMIDFGPHKSVVPTYYTIRHGGKYRADALRNWDFQGSVDGRDWTLLRRHTDDCSISAPMQFCSWSIDIVVPPLRYFRILQTGHNSSSHNFLVVSGLEIYGELILDHPVSDI